MNQPFPWIMASAEVRVVGEIIAVSVHGLTIRTQVRPEMARAIWARFHIQPGIFSLELKDDLARVELCRRSIKVWIGEMSFERPIVDRYWKFLEVQETVSRERRVANVA
jgi:hypothetical protein